ncbi:glycosyltransferase family 4 protein [uncultured Pseudoteredinibacter sp.]|uniref:glycosyltransferase family 4 protein n=1 Tax=uncultured Pseudoteredinibacter sp. TaxID=1641701 RepID=UPI00262E0217|nr:glycosyltransferase family 4 protein [uncultured Pseudoteredinibacter sp.]
MKKMMVITNIPTPYRVPFFNSLNDLLYKVGVELIVVFGARSYSRRHWEVSERSFKFKYVFLESRELGINSGESASFSYVGLFRLMYRYSPDVVVFGGFGVCAVKSIVYAKLFFKKTYVWSGEIHNKHRRVSWVRKAYRRLIGLLVSGGVAYGSTAKKYLEDICINRKSISIAKNSVDVEYFLSTPLKEPNERRILYVGNLERLKRVDLIIKSVEVLARKNVNFTLDLVGDGSARQELESYVDSNGLSSMVNFHGFIQKEDLPKFYESASLFMFPSEYDIWGLVVVESLASGVPVIASEHPGCVAELISSGENGFIVDFNNSNQVAQKVEELLGDSDKLRQFKLNARRTAVESCSLEKMAEGFLCLV